MTDNSDTVEITTGVLRIRAANRGPLTGTGTNSYLLRAAGGAVLVDAGPDLPAHVGAILAALNGAPLCAILITHPHLDHSGAAPALVAQTGARVLSFGRAAQHVGAKEKGAGQEGADFAHLPDDLVAGGAELHLAGLKIRAVHTPGHMQGHLCFGARDMLFSGDHVMGWATSLVAPPEGDMAAYRASLRALQGLGYARYLPGHGDVVDDPVTRLAYLIDHRNQREAQILAALAQGAASAQTIAAAIYTDIPPALLPAAAQNVLAHLLELAASARVTGQMPANRSTLFALC